MSNTQKNWNDFWDNYEPSRNDIAYKNMSEKENHSNFGFSHIIIAFCITITIGCIILIAAALNDKEEPLQTTTKKTTKTTTNDTSYPHTYFNISADNKNGVTMKNSVNTIQDILDKIREDKETPTEKDIDNYIITVKNTDLSNEYNEYKNKAVEKLKIARSWINTEDVEKRNELIKQYNDINSIEYLAKAFDKAGVEYWLIDENHINFYYKNQ